MIDWSSFTLVSGVSLVGACLLVGFAALGIRLLDQHGDRARLAHAGAFASFAVCAAAVLFGVYLIVPAFT